MRVAVAEDNGYVNQHFGQTRRFSIAEVENGNFRFVGDLDTSGMRHRHDELARQLKEAGVKVVITGGIGPGAMTALKAEHLEVVSGASGPVEEIVALYARGKLISTGAACEHHHDKPDKHHIH